MQASKRGMMYLTSCRNVISIEHTENAVVLLLCGQFCCLGKNFIGFTGSEKHIIILYLQIFNIILFSKSQPQVYS